MLKKLFLDLLKEPSITPNAANCFEICEEFLGDFDAKRFDKENVKNLVLSKTFSDKGVHFAFAGHIDVVPVGSGWQSDAFTPIEKDGKITARGAQDMKSGVAAFLQACRLFCQNFEAKNIGKISLIITSDEEGDAEFGTKFVLECLQKSGDLPTCVIVAEPTSDEFFGDTIKTARRGSIHANIKIIGKQGHVAYPQKCANPVHLGAKFLSEIAGENLDAGDDVFEPSKIIISNLAAGCGAVNVTPAEFNITLNVRNSVHSDEAKLREFLESKLSGLNYELATRTSSEPFSTKMDSLLVKTLKKAIENKGIKNTSCNAKGGTSDARFFAKYGCDVCEFGVQNDLIHAANESVEFAQVEKLSEIFLEFLSLINKEN